MNACGPFVCIAAESFQPHCHSFSGTITEVFKKSEVGKSLLQGVPNPEQIALTVRVNSVSFTPKTARHDVIIACCKTICANPLWVWTKSNQDYQVHKFPSPGPTEISE
jgi:hypothetical protein